MGEGNGVSELISACAFDVIANGVGHYSFTKALIIELRLLSKRISFPVSELYTHIYCRAQHHLAQGIANERYPAPIHLQLTRDDQFARGLHLSIQERPLAQDGSGALHSSGLADVKNPRTEISTTSLQCSIDLRTNISANICASSATSIPPELTNTAILTPCPSPTASSNGSTCSEQYTVDSLPPEIAPRLLLAVRFEENIRAEDLSTEYFAEWLRTIPAAVKEVKVEAGFKCDSTLLFVSLPLSLWAYLPQNAAIFPLGTIRSSNLLTAKHENPNTLGNEVCSSEESKGKRQMVLITEDISDKTPEGEDKSVNSQPISPQSPNIEVVDKSIEEASNSQFVGNTMATSRESLAETKPLLKSTKKSLNRKGLLSDKYFDRMPSYPSVAPPAGTKTWDRAFFTHHNLTDRVKFSDVEEYKTNVYASGYLSLFMQASDDLGSPAETTEVERYCHGANFQALEAGIGDAGERRASWVDDRNSPHLTGKGNARRCDNPLTATGLLRYLKQPVRT